MSEVLSPLTGSPDVVLEQTIDARQVIQQYQQQFGIDVASLFSDTEQIDVYRCSASGYQFYHPLSLSGDGPFYAQLQTRCHYYPAWKWDFETAKAHISSGDNVLEVGCGDGQFLEYLRSRQVQCTGLELNEEAVGKGKSKGLQMHGETVQAFARLHQAQFDVVCHFQVLEHVAEVQSFIQATVDLLRPGGKLIVCVPNNGGFLRFDANNVLNKPPHHVGLWNVEALTSLSSLFKLKLEQIYCEPLHQSDRSWAYATFVEYFYRVHWRLGVLVKRLPGILIAGIIKLLGERLKGHSVLAVYTKCH